MRCDVVSQSLDGDWERVSGATPCPICGGADECRTHADEAFACCVQRPSDWRLSNGGWLHRIRSSDVQLRVPERVEQRPVDGLSVGLSVGVIP
jgi:hypothetical protein